jgi:hypothetical protein
MLNYKILISNLKIESRLSYRNLLKNKKSYKTKF